MKSNKFYVIIYVINLRGEVMDVTGYVDAMSVATILHMDTSKCVYNTETTDVDTSKCEKKFNKNLYKNGVVPLLDLLYFTKKLDYHVNKRLANKNIRVVSAVAVVFQPECENTLNGMFRRKEDPNYADLITIEPTTRKQKELDPLGRANDMKAISKIVSAEMEKNGRYIIDNLVNFRNRDWISDKLLGLLDQKCKTNYKKLFENDAKFAIDYYLKTGLVITKRTNEDWSMEKDWNSARKEAIKALYRLMITDRALSDYLNFDEFVHCLISAVKDIYCHMQYVQINQNNNANERRY